VNARDLTGRTNVASLVEIIAAARSKQCSNYDNDLRYLPARNSSRTTTQWSGCAAARMDWPDTKRWDGGAMTRKNARDGNSMV